MSFYNYIKFLTQFRGLSDLISRGLSILERYGLSTNKMTRHLNTYQTLLRKYDVTATFPITATVVKRHPEIIKKFRHANIEFAIHGYNHVDMTVLSPKKQKKQIEHAIKVFQEQSIQFSGFRCPYLRHNSHISDALQKYNFSWTSSHGILWDVISRDVINKEHFGEWSKYQKATNFYNLKDASNYISLPGFQSDVVHIPVSLPDDDMLADRLTTNAAIYRIWNRILDETYEKGELFTLQLHPERIPFCKDALEFLLEMSSKHYRPPIWIASLSEISSWWREKSEFHFKITQNRENYYHIEAICPKRALVLVKNARVEYPDRDFFNDYKIMKENHFTVESSTRPVIGVSTNASANLIKFLKNEGFLFEISDKKEQYGIYFDENMYTQENERKILRIIEESPFPIIRFWRWPDSARSALSITGDIDALTSIDFLLRLFGY